MKPNMNVTPLPILHPEETSTKKRIMAVITRGIFKNDTQLNELRRENHQLRRRLRKYKSLCRRFSNKLQRLKISSSIKITALSSANKRVARHVSRLQTLSIRLIRQRALSKSHIEQQQLTLQNAERNLIAQTNTLHSYTLSYKQLQYQYDLHTRKLENNHQHTQKLSEHNQQLLKRVKRLQYFNIMLIFCIICLSNTALL
ncbi:hypothetical protein [Pseudoalteromonas sp. MMG005]|uniref:hypothetical protein n=1 Tax=Pseudoalteromonas sp. MMG005 TaxID=2822682 RepID=UPI001B39FC02|nr:hypothetical protein [Pseudoalteromonas sp. MMG005]MBQ4848138.1 hypothetical protein [Pseudoalteromonas sp. MMG005]